MTDAKMTAISQGNFTDKIDALDAPTSKENFT
jgi:hypothetical protein